MFRIFTPVKTGGDRMVLSKSRKYPLYFSFCGLICICLILCSVLSGCSNNRIYYSNDDGTVTCISYENHGVLTRTPKFSVDDGIVTMRFNGKDWYSATVINEKEFQRIKSGTKLAESTNIQVFQSKSGGYSYNYVLDLEKTDSAYILISNNVAPGDSGYGTDFDYIVFCVGDTVTKPDLNLK